MPDLAPRAVVRDLDAVVLRLDERSDTDLEPYVEDLAEALDGLHAVLGRLPAPTAPVAPPTFQETR